MSTPEKKAVSFLLHKSPLGFGKNLFTSQCNRSVQYSPTVPPPFRPPFAQNERQISAPLRFYRNFVLRNLLRPSMGIQYRESGQHCPDMLPWAESYKTIYKNEGKCTVRPPFHTCFASRFPKTGTTYRCSTFLLRWESPRYNSTLPLFHTRNKPCYSPNHFFPESELKFQSSALPATHFPNADNLWNRRPSPALLPHGNPHNRCHPVRKPHSHTLQNGFPLRLQALYHPESCPMPFCGSPSQIPLPDIRTNDIVFFPLSPDSFPSSFPGTATPCRKRLTGSFQI